MSAAATPLAAGPALARRLAAGETTFGLFLGLGSVAAAEVIAAAGADWLLADLEHGGGGEQQIGSIVAAAAAYGVPALVRVETPERIRLGRVLDAGAAGIVLPRIEHPEQVEQAVRAQHYPPDGIRGVASYNRAARWGLDRAALDRANGERITIVQIETLPALEQVDAIAAVAGVSALFVGPLDLSYALGVPRDFTSPIFQQALDRVLDAGSRRGVPVGILANDLAGARSYRDRGFRLLAVGSDSTVLASAVHELAAGLHAR